MLLLLPNSPWKNNTNNNRRINDNFTDLKDRFSLNIPGIAGVNESVRYLLHRGVAQVAQIEAELTQHLLAGLISIDNVSAGGPPVGISRAAVVSFNLRGVEPVFVANELERRADIACRPGWHCAALAHRTLGTERTGTVRLSPGPSTKMTEIETALGVIEELEKETQAS